MTIDPRDLEAWCRIPVEELANHETKIPFEIVEDSPTMGRRMALELVETIEANPVGPRVIVPCGPSSWYAPWTEEVNARGLSLADVTVFHMDECLDAQARPIPPEHPYNFRAFMEREFYGGIPETGTCPRRSGSGCFPRRPSASPTAIVEAPIDLTLGGWGQDGHVAYNQARRHPFSHVGLEELADSTIRIQDNNLDTMHRARAPHLRCRVPVRPADVDHARDARVPLGGTRAALQRHGRVEADGVPRGAVLGARPRVPDHAAPAAPGRADHRHASKRRATPWPSTRSGDCGEGRPSG